MLKLVYTCLAVAFVSFALLIFLAISSGRYFHGTTSSMLEALQSDALVLDADRYGAVIQTGNGRVLGFRRGQSEPVWSTRFDRFDEDLGWEDPPPDAGAWCIDRCPAAVVEIKGSYSARGGAAAAIAQPLNPDASVIGSSGDGLIALIDDRAMLLQSSGATALPAVPSADGGPASAAETDSDADRIVMGAAFGGRASLTRVKREGKTYQSAGTALKMRALSNICISEDGEWVGAIGSEALVGAFGSSTLRRVDEDISSGICHADSSGFTTVVNHFASRSLVVAKRHDHSGRTRWTRDLGARTLLSRGPSPLIIVAATDGTVTAVDAVSGQELAPLHLAQDSDAFASDDGVLITARRDGTPTWHEFKRSNGSTYETDR